MITSEVEKQFSKLNDISIREIDTGGVKVRLYFVECLIDKNLIAGGVIRPILESAEKLKAHGNKLDFLISRVISVPKTERIGVSDALAKILAGNCVISIEDESELISVCLQGYQTRGITEPPTNSVLKGPREGFVEDLNVNISLIRRRLQTPDLHIFTTLIGRKSQTKVALVYLASCVSPQVLRELKKRLNKIDIDGVTASYYIESLIRNNSGKLFRQVGSTEKPDIAMAKILEGRIAIIVDGTPIVLSVPYVFLEDLQSSDDYYMHPARASMVRIMRFLGLILGVLLPGLYVALESFHYRILPIDFLLSLLSSIYAISFPPLIEILFVLFLFEILNEASIRMPKYLGMALSIIGALVLGDEAVKAGIITPPSIIVVAISGICLYIVPDQTPIMSLMRILFTLLGGFAGFFGVIMGLIFFVGMLTSINNFGAPLMAPFAPKVNSDLKDGLIKSSTKQMITRPMSFPNRNRVRQAPRSAAQAKDILGKGKSNG